MDRKGVEQGCEGRRWHLGLVLSHCDVVEVKKCSRTLVTSARLCGDRGTSGLQALERERGKGLRPGDFFVIGSDP